MGVVATEEDFALGRAVSHRAETIAHAVFHDHGFGQLGGLLDVVVGAG